MALLAKKPVFMRLCEQCQMAQFNGKWHSSNQRNLVSLGVCFNNLKYKSIVISTNSATWHCSKTQVLCRFEPNSAIFPSSALGQLGVGPLRPLRGHSRLPARSSAERCPLGTSAPPKGEARLGFVQTFCGAHTWLSLWGRYVPVGRCPAAGLRCRVGRCWTSATGRQHPRRQPSRWRR